MNKIPTLLDVVEQLVGRPVILTDTAVYVDGIRKTTNYPLTYNAAIRVDGYGRVWVSTGTSRWLK